MYQSSKHKAMGVRTYCWGKRSHQ